MHHKDFLLLFRSTNLEVCWSVNCFKGFLSCLTDIWKLLIAKLIGAIVSLQLHSILIPNAIDFNSPSFCFCHSIHCYLYLLLHHLVHLSSIVLHTVIQSFSPQVSEFICLSLILLKNDFCSQVVHFGKLCETLSCSQKDLRSVWCYAGSDLSIVSVFFLVIIFNLCSDTWWLIHYVFIGIFFFSLPKIKHVPIFRIVCSSDIFSCFFSLITIILSKRFSQISVCLSFSSSFEVFCIAKFSIFRFSVSFFVLFLILYLGSLDFLFSAFLKVFQVTFI